MAKPPLKIWIQLTLIGGFLGALNPAWYLLKPEYIDRIQSSYSFDYSQYAVAMAAMNVVFLIIPAIISTFILLPWYYEYIKNKQKNGKINFYRKFLYGTLFGLVASFPTAFFALCQLVLISFYKDGFDIGSFLMPIFGTFMITPVIAILCLPAIFISGWIFTTIVAYYVKTQDLKTQEKP